MFHFPFGGSSGAREDGVLRRERMNLRIFWLRAARLLSSSIVDTKHLSQSSAAASLTKVKSKKLPQKQKVGSLRFFS